MDVQHVESRGQERRCEITVPGFPPTGNSRLHWRVRQRRIAEFRDVVAWQARALSRLRGWQGPFVRARVTLTLHHRSRRYFMDPDNAYACAKGPLDGLKGVLIRDDSAEYITLEVRQDVADWRGMTLEVTEILDQDDPKEATGHGKTEG